MIKSSPIAQADLLCTNCAGQCVYAPELGALTCKSCGAEHSIVLDPNADPAVEQHYDPDLPHTEQPRFTQERPYQCETCGGEVIFHGHSISENCPYCNGALVERPKDESYLTLGMVPFSVGKEHAQVNAQAWASRRWAAPSDLGAVVSRSRVSGIYVPFWTFDSKEAVKYTVMYKVKQGKGTALRSDSGFMRAEFDDLLMPASSHVTPLIRDGILHEFDPSNLRPFEPAYLAGFAAERHHQSVREGLMKNATDKALLLRNRIKKHSGKNSIVEITYLTDTTGIKYRRILLPVWILHYEYNEKPMKIVTCGLQGRTFGERPFSMVKLLVFAALASSAVVAFGFVWGALNLY
jgi:ribosomal protein S27E